MSDSDEVAVLRSSTVVPCCTVAQAARHGHLDELKILIEQEHPVDVHDNRGWKPTHEAAFGNHVDCLELLLKHDKTDINWQSFEEWTALKLAANEGNIDCVRLLLENGADPNICDIYQTSPLMAAVNARNIACIWCLLEHGANVNYKDYSSATALHFAVSKDCSDIVDILLEHGAKPDIGNELGLTPVFTAAQEGRTQCLQCLVNHLRKTGSLEVLNICADDGASPLYLASQDGHTDCVRLLLDSGANANLATLEPIALPLHAALQFNHIECVKLLLPHTDRLRLLVCSASPFYFSMMHSDAKATQCLLNAGLSPNTAYDSADYEAYQPRVLQYFNNEVRFGRQFNALIILAMNKYSLHNAGALLAGGASPNVLLPCRVPPLLPALDMSNLDLVRMLIGVGAKINVYHPRVLGNMTVITCLHFWRGLRFVLSCGAEVQSLFCSPELFKSRYLDSSGDCVEVDDDDDDDYENEVGVLSIPVPFWRILAEARYMMTRRKVKIAEVLNLILYYAGSVRLDLHLAGYVDSTDEWNRIKAITESPRSLSHLCRLAVRSCFTPRQLLTDVIIRFLPLPNVVHDFLLFTELD